MKQIKRLALVYNRSKSGAKELADELAKLASAHGGVVTSLTGDYPLPEDFLTGQDACAVLGGDGTLLGVVQESIRRQVPVFGINQGKLGFLAIFSPEDIRNNLESILDGNYEINDRLLLECQTADKATHYALNDVVIKTKSMSKLVTLRVSLNGELVNCYDCDGLIFTTPTGSTAYNLSANGPIIHPDAHAIAMTPICPHTLSNRSLIFSGDVVLQTDIAPGQEACVSTDGRLCETGTQFPLKICTSDITLPLLQPMGHSYFHILRSKLEWGEDIEE